MESQTRGKRGERKKTTVKKDVSILVILQSLVSMVSFFSVSR